MNQHVLRKTSRSLHSIFIHPINNADPKNHPENIGSQRNQIMQTGDHIGFGSNLFVWDCHESDDWEHIPFVEDTK
jgi:hypothetical protein